MPAPATIERILTLLERSGVPAEGIASMRTYLDSLEAVSTRLPQGLPVGQLGYRTRGFAGRQTATVYTGRAANGMEMAALLLANYDLLQSQAGSSYNLDQAIRQAIQAGAEPTPDETLRFLTYEVPREFREAIGGDSLLHGAEREAVRTGQAQTDLRVELDGVLERVLLEGNSGGLLTVRRDDEGNLWYKPFATAGVEYRIDTPDDLVDYQSFVTSMLEGGDLAPWFAQSEDTGAPIIQEADVDLYTLPEQPRDPTDPYIGGIPGDYVSNRLIVRPGNAATFDRRQRELEGQTGAFSFQRYSRSPQDIGRSMEGVGFATPVHEEYDQYSMFAGKDPAYRASVMKGMMDAGYLDPNEVAGSLGYWSPAAAGAAKQWLFEANVSGFGNDIFRFLEDRGVERKTIEDALDADADRRSGGGASAPTYHAPDYATLSQAVKAYVEQRVGRKVKDYELTLLADKMAADFRADFDAQVAASRGGGGGGSGNRDIEGLAEYMLDNQAAGLDPSAGLEAFLAGNDPTQPTAPLWQGTYAAVPGTTRQPATVDPEAAPLEGGGGGGGGTVTNIDPYARLGENVDSQFATEIDRNKRVADIRGNTNHMMNVLAGLEGA